MRRLARGLKILVWPGLLVIGMPVGLLRFPDRPSLPRHLPTNAQWAAFLAEPATRTSAVAGFIALGWLAWAILIWAILTDIRRWAARLRRRLPQMRLPGPLQSLTAAILGAVAVSSAGPATSAAPPAIHVGLTQPTTGHQPTWHLTARVTPPVSQTTRQGSPPMTTPDTSGSRGTAIVRAGEQHYTYTVHRGDSLWHIAAQWLGNPTRWPEIYHLNQSHYDQHGRMRHGDHIQPGWVLALPNDATPPPGTPPAPPPRQPGPDQGPARKNVMPTAPAPTPSPTATTSPTGGVASNGGTPQPAAPATSGAGADAGPGRHDDATGMPPGVPTRPASNAAPHTTADPAASTGNPARSRQTRGVSLPGGSWVDLGLALAVTAAVTLVWAHRRHRYTPQPPTPDLRINDPDLAPMPPVVTQIRRELRHITAAPSISADRSGSEFDRPGNAADFRGGDGREPAAKTSATTDPADTETVQLSTEETAPVVAALLADTDRGAWPARGLGLTGPGAHAAARGLLARALAAGGLDDPDARSQVVIPSATAAVLLGAAALPLPDTPRLTVTAGLGQALEILEAQTLHRTRLLYQQEVADVDGLLRADPYAEPLPPIVLIAEAVAEHEQARVAALLSQGQRLQIHGVLVGAWPASATMVVADDGTTTLADDDTRQGSDPDDAGRFAVLNPTETLDLIATLAESHTGLPQTPPTQATDTTRVAVPASATATDINPPDPFTQAVSFPAPRSEADDPRNEPGTVPPSVPPPPVEADPIRPADTPDQGDAGGPYAAASSTDADDVTAALTDTVAVTVLGGAHIADIDPTYHLRAKARELLVYLAVHDGAARHDAILDDLIPEAPASKAPHRMHTYVSSLRQALRRATGQPASFINHTPLQYTLTVELFDVDLWRMRQALREAQHATDPQARAAALRRAIDTYQGPLAAGFDYEWVEPYRHAIREQVLDAHLALAETLDGQPVQQLPVLHAAIDLDPTAEPAYQQAMRAHAALRDLDAIRNLRRTLTRHLTEIDAEPGEDTLALADQLITQLQHATRRPGPRRETPHQGESGRELEK
jgi:DNA-binding SARP family transcriptional activator